MSTLTVNLTSDVVYVTQPEQSITIESGEIDIHRIVDIPGQKKVVALVGNIGLIDLDELSGDNYDTPAEWTNADVVAAITNILNS